VHIPALLRKSACPIRPRNPPPAPATIPIELGTPLEVETRMTLHLPPGTTTQTPTGTAVQRDYATFASNTPRKARPSPPRATYFLFEQIPAERAGRLQRFPRAVQNDEAQDFTLDRPTAAPSNALSPNSPKLYLPQTNQALT